MGICSAIWEYAVPYGNMNSAIGCRSLALHGTGLTNVTKLKIKSAMCLDKQVDAFLEFFRMDQLVKMCLNCLNLLKIG
jgi:hypothetical protein